MTSCRRETQGKIRCEEAAILGLCCRCCRGDMCHQRVMHLGKGLEPQGNAIACRA